MSTPPRPALPMRASSAPSMLRRNALAATQLSPSFGDMVIATEDCNSAVVDANTIRSARAAISVAAAEAAAAAASRNGVDVASSFSCTATPPRGGQHTSCTPSARHSPLAARAVTPAARSWGAVMPVPASDDSCHAHSPAAHASGVAQASHESHDVASGSGSGRFLVVHLPVPLELLDSSPMSERLSLPEMDGTFQSRMSTDSTMPSTAQSPTPESPLSARLVMCDTVPRKDVTWNGADASLSREEVEAEVKLIAQQEAAAETLIANLEGRVAEVVLEASRSQLEVNRLRKALCESERSAAAAQERAAGLDIELAAARDSYPVAVEPSPEPMAEHAQEERRLPAQSPAKFSRAVEYLTRLDRTMTSWMWSAWRSAVREGAAQRLKQSGRHVLLVVESVLDAQEVRQGLLPFWRAWRAHLAAKFAHRAVVPTARFLELRMAHDASDLKRLIWAAWQRHCWSQRKASRAFAAAEKAIGAEAKDRAKDTLLCVWRAWTPLTPRLLASQTTTRAGIATASCFRAWRTRALNHATRSRAGVVMARRARQSAEASGVLFLGVLVWQTWRASAAACRKAAVIRAYQDVRVARLTAQSKVAALRLPWRVWSLRAATRAEHQRRLIPSACAVAGLKSELSAPAAATRTLAAAAWCWWRGLAVLGAAKLRLESGWRGRRQRLAGAFSFADEGRLLACVVDLWWRVAFGAAAATAQRVATVAAERRKIGLHLLVGGDRENELRVLLSPWGGHSGRRDGGVVVLACWKRWRSLASASCSGRPGPLRTDAARPSSARRSEEGQGGHGHGQGQGQGAAEAAAWTCRQASLLRARQLIALQRGSLGGEVSEADVDRAGKELLQQVRIYEEAVGALSR